MIHTKQGVTRHVPCMRHGLTRLHACQDGRHVLPLVRLQQASGFDGRTGSAVSAKRRTKCRYGDQLRCAKRLVRPAASTTSGQLDTAFGLASALATKNHERNMIEL